MKIVFLLPEVARLPMGGFKVAFEYANRMADDGYEVEIMLSTSLIAGEFSFKAVIRKWLRFLLYLLFKEAKPTSWFDLNPKIKCRLVPSLHQAYAPKADVYIATAMQTSIYLNRYKTNAEKFYFIQGYEFWARGEDALLKTYSFDMRKFVVSKYLQKEVEKSGNSAILIPNGFDFTKFDAILDISKRDSLCLGTLYHPDPLKGFPDAIKSVDIVRERYPNIKLKVFGTIPKHFDQPYIEYVANPDAETLCDLYNDCSIFIGASRSEGFGFTIGEAMICSAAVVCTDTGGYLETAQHQYTALVSSVGDVEAMANNIILLIENDQLRKELVCNAKDKIANFTWDSSYVILKSEIER